RGVDDAGAHRGGGVEDIAGAADVHRVELVGAGVERVEAADVKDGVAALGGGAHRARVAKVAGDALDAARVGEIRVRPPPDEGPHRRAAREENARDGAADESAGAGDERSHGARSTWTSSPSAGARRLRARSSDCAAARAGMPRRAGWTVARGPRSA